MIETADITQALRTLGVAPGDTLFVHAGMQGALRVAGRTREEKLDTVLDAFEATVPTGTLMLPTFTYSFCGGEDFDVAASPSTVGLLTERFRTRPGVRRTHEPLFSVAVRGALPADREAELFAAHDVSCFGERSVFAHLYEVDAKLVFFGVGFEFCTFLYLVEQREQVPYRYFKPFTGDVIDGDERTPVQASYFVRRLDQDVVNDFVPLRDELLARGLATELALERGPQIFSAPARAIADVATEMLRRDPDYLLTRGVAA